MLGFLPGSRYCETEHMSDLARELFGAIPGGWARVQAICDYVHERISFGYGYASATRTAAQAHEDRVGVCRDFAHLAVTLCRCMNIPARYVNDYLGDIGVPADPAPMDFPLGSRFFPTGAGTPSTPGTTRPASGACPSRADATRPTSRCSTPSGRTRFPCSRSGPASRRPIQPSRRVRCATGQ